MKLFITGGTGFLGGHLIRRVARGPHGARCLARDARRLEWAREAGFEVCEGDITDPVSLREGMDGCDAVLNLASVNTHWEPDPGIYRRVNVDGTRNVLQTALDARVERVVNVSTALVFGKPAETPFTERSAFGPARFSAYARSKLAADRIAERMCIEQGLPLVTVYPGGVVGPGNTKQTSEYITALLEGRLPGVIFPNASHTYVDVGDVAEIVVRAAEGDVPAGERYLAGNEQLTMAELNAIVAQLADVPLPRVRIPDAVMTAAASLATTVANVTKRRPFQGMARDSFATMRAGLVFDGSKAERELGITYTPLRESLAAEVASHRSGRSRERRG